MPCMCGATDCPRCFPESHWHEGAVETISNLFPDKACHGCDCSVWQPGEDEDTLVDCRVLIGDSTPDRCQILKRLEKIG